MALAGEHFPEDLQVTMLDSSALGHHHADARVVALQMFQDSRRKLAGAGAVHRAFEFHQSVIEGAFDLDFQLTRRTRAKRPRRAAIGKAVERGMLEPVVLQGEARPRGRNRRERRENAPAETGRAEQLPDFRFEACRRLGRRSVLFRDTEERIRLADFFRPACRLGAQVGRVGIVIPLPAIQPDLDRS